MNSVIIDLYMIQSYDQSRVARGRVRPERAELCPFHEARGRSIDPSLSHYRDGFLPILGDYVSHRRLWAEAGNAASPISTSSGTIRVARWPPCYRAPLGPLTHPDRFCLGHAMSCDQTGKLLTNEPKLQRWV